MAASKFTPEIRGALLERIAAGVSQRDACNAAGVTEKTVKAWLARGRRGEKDYVEFVQAVEAAREEARSRPEPLSEDEHRRLVSEAARKGSVSAMKLYWEMILEDRKPNEDEQEPADPLDELDELSERRAVRAG